MNKLIPIIFIALILSSCASISQGLGAFGQSISEQSTQPTYVPVPTQAQCTSFGSGNLYNIQCY